MSLTREEGREDSENGWKASLKTLVRKNGMVAALTCLSYLMITLIERR